MTIPVEGSRNRKRPSWGTWGAIVVVALSAPAMAAGGAANTLQTASTLQTEGGRVRAPFSIAAGPDGNLWFTDRSGDQIGRMTLAGDVTTFRDPAGNVDSPWDITAGPDGNVWFTSNGSDRIGRITPDGTITTFKDPAGDIRDPLGIAAGPDGNVWFTSNGSDRIGRITPEGKITTFEDPALRAPLYITTSADGALYFTNGGNTSTGSNRIGRITPEGGISISKGDKRFRSDDIAADPAISGELWLIGLAPGNGFVGRLATASGELTTYAFPPFVIASPERITVGPDHNAWFTYDESHPHVGRSSYDGSTYEVTPYSVLSAQEGAQVGDIAVGPDGNLWFILTRAYKKDECRNKVGRVTCSINRITLTGEQTRFKLE